MFIPAKLLACSSLQSEQSHIFLRENVGRNIFADYLTFEFSIAADALLNHQLARIGRHNRQRRIGEGAAQETRRPNENEPLQHLHFERTRPGTSLEHGSELCR